MAEGDRVDPYLSFRFRVEIGGLEVAGFSEVSGLKSEIEIKTIREGGQNAFSHKLAGPASYPENLVVKSGLTSDDALWRWFEKTLKGNIERKNISIILLDSAGEEQKRWSFEAALPVKWTGPQFRAATAEVAIEAIEFVHQGLIPC